MTAMGIADILTPERTRCCQGVGSKKRALSILSELCAGSDEHARTLFDCLLAREKLGSTGLGFGVAVPHGRTRATDHAIGSLILLDRAIDFDASDNQPVDILFGLFVPEESTQAHLKLLSQLAKVFSQPGARESLRKAGSAQMLFQRALQFHINESI